MVHSKGEQPYHTKTAGKKITDCFDLTREEALAPNLEIQPEVMMEGHQRVVLCTVMIAR